MKKILVFALLSILLLLPVVCVQAQVGYNKTPSVLTELDIQNMRNANGDIVTPKSIMIPRISTSGNLSLLP